MADARAALVRWTGSGSVQALRSTVASMLKEEGSRGSVRVVGRSVMVSETEPAAVAGLLAFTPGVAWTAAGYRLESREQIPLLGKALSSAYLRAGTRFSVQSEGTGGAVASDLTGAFISAILDAGSGARVSEGGPEVKFRVAFDGTRGVAGAEVRQGPGGTTTGERWATCLVSGGKHSGVVAWMALLAGYRVRMVHAREDEVALRSVARLYSELSHRVARGAVELSVLEGRGAQSSLARTRLGERAFGGFHQGRDAPSLLRGVAAPLFLLPEEVYDLEAGSLMFKPVERSANWSHEKGVAKELTFAGARAGVSEVLDGLRPRPR